MSSAFATPISSSHHSARRGRVGRASSRPGLRARPGARRGEADTSAYALCPIILLELSHFPLPPTPARKNPKPPTTVTGRRKRVSSPRAQAPSHGAPRGNGTIRHAPPPPPRPDGLLRYRRLRPGRRRRLLCSADRLRPAGVRHGNATAFRASLAPLLTALPSAALRSQPDPGRDRAHALGLCFGFGFGGVADASDCHACLRAAVAAASEGCANDTRRAGVWSHGCLLAYYAGDVASSYTDGLEQTLADLTMALAQPKGPSLCESSLLLPRSVHNVTSVLRFRH